jgi:energy-coupling factor transporter ATP-binding protein EcfA2
MTSALIANYDEERVSFRGLLAPSSQRRILMFRGRSGSGKTTLLRTCLQEVPPEYIKVPVQFRDTAVNMAEIFYRVGEHVGWDHMPQFTGQLASLRGLPTVQVENNLLEGSHNQINVALQAENPTDREHRRAALTNAWFADLYALAHPLLLAMDTYEQATTDVAHWVEGPFLSRTARTPRLRVLLAGQTVPDANNIEWGTQCHTHDLYGVHEAAHWLPVVEAMNRLIEVPDPLSWLAGICYALHGQPKDIMQVIENLPRREAA